MKQNSEPGHIINSEEAAPLLGDTSINPTSTGLENMPEKVRVLLAAVASKGIGDDQLEGLSLDQVQGRYDSTFVYSVEKRRLEAELNGLPIKYSANCHPCDYCCGFTCSDASGPPPAVPGLIPCAAVETVTCVNNGSYLCNFCDSPVLARTADLIFPCLKGCSCINCATCCVSQAGLCIASSVIGFGLYMAWKGAKKGVYSCLESCEAEKIERRVDELNSYINKYGLFRVGRYHQSLNQNKVPPVIKMESFKAEDNSVGESSFSLEGDSPAFLSMHDHS